MEKSIVITNTPVRLPVSHTVLAFFLLYHFNVSDIVIGIAVALYSIIWILVLIVKFNEKSISIDFNEKDITEPTSTVSKNRFQERLEDALKQQKEKKK